MKVVYRLEALGDLNNLFSYIEQDNPVAADMVSKRIQRTVERLADFPLTARHGAVEGTYELVVPHVP